MYDTHAEVRTEFTSIHSKNTIHQIHEMIAELVNHGDLECLPPGFYYNPPKHVNGPLRGRAIAYTCKENYKAIVTSAGLLPIKADDDWHNLVTKNSKPLFVPPKKARKGKTSTTKSKPKPAAYSVELSVFLTKKPKLGKKKRDTTSSTSDSDSSTHHTKKKGRGTSGTTVLANKLRIELHAALMTEDKDGGRFIKPKSTEKKDVLVDISKYIITVSCANLFDDDDSSVSCNIFIK